MAREYGQLRHDLWLDDDWLNLSMPAQWLYMTLLGDSRLSYCGVGAYHLGKLAQRAGETAAKDVLLAAAELSDAFFVIIDEDTEEIMVRSYLRHDPLMKNPRLAVAMAKDFGSIASKKIRAALVHELTRLKKEQPDLGAWDKPGVKTILRQTGVNPREMVTDLPTGADTHLGTGLGMRLGMRLLTDNGKRVDDVYLPPTTETATTTETTPSSKDDAPPKKRSYPQPKRATS